MADYSLVNGVDSDRIALQDRGLAYGDGVFETIRVVAGSPRFLDLHLARARHGCQRLDMQLDSDRLHAEIQRLLAHVGNRHAILKIILTRAWSGRGYSYQRPATSNRYLHLHIDAAIGGSSEGVASGVRLVVCRHRLPLNPALAGIKHLNRLDNVLARAEWQGADADEGLMLDSEGRVIEGTMSNLFLVDAGELATPQLHRCGVAGIMRQVIIEQLSTVCDLPVRERDLTLDDVIGAGELFICNSLLGIRPVIELMGEPRRSGAATRALQRALGAYR